MRTMQNTKWIQVAIVIFALGSSVMASPEFIPIQERAQGRSLAGSTTLNDSLYSNPAGSAFTQVYSVEGTYNLPKDLAVSILDTKTTGIGGGLGYFRHVTPYADSLQGFKLAFVGRASEVIGLGISGKAMWGPDGANNHANLTDMDAGMLVNLDPVQLGLTTRNLFGGNAALDQNREVALGGRLGYEDTLYLNVAAISTFTNVKPYQYSIGAEYISTYFFSLKGGFRYLPDIKATYWSAGISLLAPKIYIHYAVEFPSVAKLSAEHTIAVGLMF